MLNIETLTVGQLAENCYIVWDSNTKEGLIIDPGDDSDYIIQRLTDKEITPTAIIATHAHFDHIGAVLPLTLGLSIPFVMHQKDEVLLNHFRESCIHFTQVDPGPPPKPSKFVQDGDIIYVGSNKLQVIEAPGHTPGTINLYSKEGNILFVGDNLFADGALGRTDFAYCNKTDLLGSIMKLLKLPDNTHMFSGHGESFLLKDVKGYFSTD